MKHSLLTLSIVLFSSLAYSQVSIRAYTGASFLPVSDLNLGMSYGNQVNFDSISRNWDIGVGISYDFGDAETWNFQDDESESGPNPATNREPDGNGLVDFIEPWNESHIYSGYIRLGYHLLQSEKNRLTLGTGISLTRVKYRYVQSTASTGSNITDLQYYYANFLDVGLMGYAEYAYSLSKQTDLGLQLSFNNLLYSYDRIAQAGVFVQYHF